MTTSIPAAIDYLVTNLSAAMPAETQVLDGPPGTDLENHGIAIGYALDEPSVTSQESGAGLNSSTEEYDINSMVWARSGEEQPKVVRDQLFALINALDAALKADRELGGAVVFAQLRVVDFDQTRNEDGTWAVATVAIACKAFK